MFAADTVSVARKRADVALRRRVREFATVVDRIMASAVDRGMLHSGTTQRQLGDAIRDEYEARALLLWDILLDLGAHGTRGDSAHLAAQLKSLVSELLDSGVADLDRNHAKAVQLMPGIQLEVRSLDEYREEAMESVDAAIGTALLKTGTAKSLGVSADTGLTLFIGSSASGRAQAKALADALVRPGLTFLPWWEAFTPGRELLAELDSIRERVDGALLLFTPESKTTIRRKSVAIPNLNVLFEFGYFYGHFGPHRVGMVRYGEIYLPSDFGGYIYISGSGKFRRATATKVATRTINDFDRWVGHL